ncbi:MAG: 16S rRNA (guanine(527)-N(7))-methyltransferase RsmG [Pseudomonadota bacterium]
MGLTAHSISQLHAYLALLEKWNKVYNLTALRDSSRMLTHHVFDSLSTLPAVQRQCPGQTTQLLDVGSGAGLPGVVLAIALPHLTVTCIDTVGKKAAFVQQVAGELRLTNLRSVHSRVEQWESTGFDIVTSRAFASLRDFTHWTRRQLKPHGVWMAMKGKVPQEELDALPVSVKAFHVEQLTVPGMTADRCLIWMRPA